MLALVFYVGVLTPRRDNDWEGDAWEHHRAILALTETLWKPGNPTFATDEPSIRYSPYSVALALLCLATRMDPYDAMTLAAVLNTLLLCVGVRMFLRAYGHADAAATTLLVMVGLTGVNWYANTYGLSALPMVQANPSAFAFALTLWAWSRFREDADGRWTWRRPLLITVLTAVATLSHAMTGVACLIGLAVVGMTGPTPRRHRMLVTSAAVAAVTLLLGALWPWYDFIGALTKTTPNAQWDWFQPWILTQMLTEWCGPAILLSVCALPMRDRQIVRTCLLGGGVLFALAVTSYVTRSAVTARFPMVGVFFLHVAIGLFVRECGLLHWRTWPGRLGRLLDPDWRIAARPVLELVVCLVFLSTLGPQIRSLAREPHPAAGYLARLLGRPDGYQDVKRRLDRLLTDVGRRDVVLSDVVTSWPIPSSRGRIVSAAHLEYFSPDQARRYRDVLSFFSADDDAVRREVLDRHHVRWIVLHKRRLGAKGFAPLLEPSAVVRQDGDLVLMDAEVWKKARRNT